METVSNNQHIHKHLIERCQKNDAKAQQEIYKLYVVAMYNICRRIMGSDEDAQDILQESFMDVFLKLPSLRDVGFFSAWIKRIVTNNCINALRKKRMLTDELEENIDLASEEEDDFDYQNFRIEKVKQAVENLPDGCRTVLSLYAFEGYDHKEIGEILGITESASKAQYSKAKAKIRKMLTDTTAKYA